MINLWVLLLPLFTITASLADLVLLEDETKDAFVSDEADLLDILSSDNEADRERESKTNRGLRDSRYGLVPKYNGEQFNLPLRSDQAQNRRFFGQGSQTNIIRGGRRSRSREESSSSSSESRSRERNRPHRRRWPRKKKRPKKPKRRCRRCPPGWEDQRNRFGKCYKEKCHGTCNFDNAVLSCKTAGVRGSKLVEPNFANGEVNFLYKFVRVDSKLWWIGVKRIGHNLQYLESGRTVSTSLVPWAKGEPTNGKEECVALKKTNSQPPAVWDDPCADIWGFAICEIRRRPCRRQFG